MYSSDDRISVRMDSVVVDRGSSVRLAFAALSLGSAGRDLRIAEEVEVVGRVRR